MNGEERAAQPSSAQSSAVWRPGCRRGSPPLTREVVDVDQVVQQLLLLPSLGLLQSLPLLPLLRVLRVHIATCCRTPAVLLAAASARPCSSRRSSLSSGC